MQRLLALAALFSAATPIGQVQAQPVALPQGARVEQREQEAAAHFERGEALYANRQLSAAIEAFTASYRLVPTANVAFNIAQTHELLERVEDAFNWYQVCLAIDEDETARRARERIAALSPQVAALAVTAAPSEAMIAIDGVEQGASSQSPRMLAVTPGRHRLSARCPRCVAAEAFVDAERGRIVSVVLSLEPLPGTLSVESVPEGAAVMLHPQLRLLGVTPLTVQLPVGPARLLLRHDGYVDRDVTTQIRSDAVTMLAISLVQHTTPGPRRATTGAVPPAKSSTAQGLGDLRWAGYGTAAALLVTGGVLGIFALNKHDEVQADPERKGKDGLNRLNLATDLTLGTGLVLAGVTLTLDLTLTD